MNTSRSAMRNAVLIPALALCVPAAALAQQRDARVNPPLAPVGESSSKAPEAAGAIAGGATAATTQPDQRPLSGAELFSLGSFGGGHTYLLPSFSFTQGSSYRDGAFNFRGNVRGGLALHRDTAGSQMALSYNTGAVLDNSRRGFGFGAHSLAFSQGFTLRRWTLTFADTFSYLPASAFAFGIYDGIGRPNIGSQPNWVPGQSGGNGSQGGLDPFFIPDQSVLGRDGTRYSNTVIGQAAYQPSARVMWTAAGSIGILRFREPGFIESNSGTFRTGFNYTLSARDTVAVIYGLSMQRFDGGSSFDNHVLHLSYGRRVTGRLAWQVAAGPNFNVFDTALQGAQRRASWSTSTHLTHGTERGMIGLGYTLSTTGGSGTFRGARTHWVQFTGGRQLSQQWSLHGEAAFAHNRGVSELNSLLLQRTSATWRAGVDLGRPVGRYMRFSVRYQLVREHAGCPVGVPTCSSPSGRMRHNFGINLDFSKQFSPRPIELD